MMGQNRERFPDITRNFDGWEFLTVIRIENDRLVGLSAHHEVSGSIPGISTILNVD